MGRIIAAAAAVAVLSLSAAGCGDAHGASDQAVAGTWEGMGVQTPDSDAPRWPLRVVLDVRGGGTIAYPTLQCGGTLTRLRSLGHTVVYREIITYGADTCIEGGTVTVVKGQDRLFWYWTGEGTAEPQVSAAAVLMRPAPRRRP
jgi:hypothetical protein